MTQVDQRHGEGEPLAAALARLATNDGRRHVHFDPYSTNWPLPIDADTAERLALIRPTAELRAELAEAESVAAQAERLDGGLVVLTAGQLVADLEAPVALLREALAHAKPGPATDHARQRLAHAESRLARARFALATQGPGQVVETVDPPRSPWVDLPDRAAAQRKLQRARAALHRAEARDALLARRPEGCFCYGVGGRHRVWLLDSEAEAVGQDFLFRDYCGCPEGVARQAQDGAARARLAVLRAAARREADLLAASVPGLFRDVSLHSYPVLDPDPAAGIVGNRDSFTRACAWWSSVRAGLARKRGIVLWGEPGVGKCLRSDELVRLASGAMVPASSLVGQHFEVLSAGPDMAVAPRLAYATDNGVRSVLRIATETGRVLFRTPEHPFWGDAEPLRGTWRSDTQRRRFAARPCWVRAEDLRAGSVIAAYGDNPIPEAEIPDHQIILAAYLISDGNTTPNGSSTRLRFTQQEGPVLEEFARACAAYNCVAVRSGRYEYNVAPGPGSDFRDRHAVNAVREAARDWGIIGSAWTKHFPSWVWHLGSRQLALFLSRLFACDGWAYSGKSKPVRGGVAVQVGYTTVSEALAFDVSRALLRLGIRSRLSQRRTSWRHRTVLRRSRAFTVELIRGPDVARFCDRVGIFGKEVAVGRAAKVANDRAVFGRPLLWRNSALAQPFQWERVVTVERCPVAVPTVSIHVPETGNFIGDHLEHNSGCAGAFFNDWQAWRRELGKSTDGLFVVVPDLLDALRATYAHEDQTVDDLLRQIRRAPMVVLDDIGTEKLTKWGAEKLFQIINSRHDEVRCADAPITIFTSNLHPDVLAAHFANAVDRDPSPDEREIARMRGKRIVRRILEMAEVLEFIGDDLSSAEVRAYLDARASAPGSPEVAF